MGTRNFAQHDEKHLYILNDLLDEVDCDIAVENARDLCDNLAEKYKSIESFYDEWAEDDRNYCQVPVATLQCERQFAGALWGVNVHVVITGGYYADASIGYHVRLDDPMYGECRIWDDLTSSIEDLRNTYGLDNLANKLHKIQDEIHEWAEKKAEWMTEKVEKEVLAQVASDEIKCMAVMSNGEGVYEKVNN